MSTITMVKNIKEIHPNFVLCFKIGNFYHCYGKDAYIVSYLFDYNLSKVKDGISTCGFPKASITKVMARLEQRKLNYITFDTKNEYDIEEKQDYKNLNTYDNIYKKANKYLRIKKKIEGIEEYLLQNIEDEETIEKLRKIESIVYEI